MALKEDYKDAVFAGLRKYKMLDNGDGTVSPVDMTEYETAGDKFGAKDVNAITKMVNCTGDAFDPGRDYEAGDYTIYDNTVWKFTTAHPAGEWDESHVEKTRILVEIAEQNKNFEALTEKIIAETVDFGVVQINSGSTAGLAIPAKDGYTIASATPYSNSGSESTQTNVITFVNAVSGAKKAFYKNTSSSAISNRLMVDIIYAFVDPRIKSLYKKGR